MKLRTAMAVALEPFIDPKVITLAQDAVVEIVTDTALEMLLLFCGLPSAERPRGILRGEDISARP